MGVSETLHRFSQLPAVGAFLLRGPEQRIASYPQSAIERMRELFHAAELRLQGADELIEGQALASLPLYREAALLYMAALVAVERDTPLPETIEVERIVFEFKGLVKRRPCPTPENELGDFLRLLVAADPLVLDRLPQEEATERVRRVRLLVGWLRDLNEPRTLREIKTTRWIRVVALTLSVLGLLVWGTSVIFKAHDIALHKPVTASSVHPNATSIPGGLVDGVTSGSYGIHTNKEESPWVMVDLLEVFRLDKVKIYNRGDGWFDDALPMTLEFSENGTDFVEVDKRTQSFGTWMPWTFDAKQKKARFIRVRGNRGTFVSLNELEAYGKK
jgi:hypothetical protein